MIFFYLKITIAVKCRNGGVWSTQFLCIHAQNKLPRASCFYWFRSFFLSFFLSYFISSPTPSSCYCNPSAVATHVHYTCVMHQEAKRKRENRISSASPPILPLNHRYRPHTFSFGLSAQKKREEGVKGRRGRRKEQMWRRFEGTKLRSQSSRRRIDLNHSLNKTAFLSY